MLSRDVVDSELDQGDPVADERLTVWTDGRVVGGFQQELRAIGVLRGDHGKPGVVTQGMSWRP